MKAIIKVMDIKIVKRNLNIEKTKIMRFNKSELKSKRKIVEIG